MTQQSNSVMTSFEKDEISTTESTDELVPNPPAGVAPRYLAIDFDGVLHDYDGFWQGDSVITGGLLEGAADFLYECVQRYTVGIYSVRSATKEGRAAMKCWLVEKLADAIGEKAAEIVESIDFPEHKPFASLMIDDRAMRFEGEFPPLSVVEDYMQRPFAAE